MAKRAGVGIGTLYRHFPTRESLFEAVYRREVQQLWELAEQLKGEGKPVDALRRWLRSNVEFVATKKGMSAALALAVHRSSDLHAYTLDRLTKAVGALLDRAVAAGEIRSDVSPEDLLRALVGMCYMHDQPGWQASVMRLVDVFVDGLRVVGKAKRPLRENGDLHGLEHDGANRGSPRPGHERSCHQGAKHAGSRRASLQDRPSTSIPSGTARHRPNCSRDRCSGHQERGARYSSGRAAYSRRAASTMFSEKSEDINFPVGPIISAAANPVSPPAASSRMVYSGSTIVP